MCEIKIFYKEIVILSIPASMLHNLEFVFAFIIYTKKLLKVLFPHQDFQLTNICLEIKPALWYHVICTWMFQLS